LKDIFFTLAAEFNQNIGKEKSNSNTNPTEKTMQNSKSEVKYFNN